LSSATALVSVSLVISERSVFLGKYCRSSPLVFLLLPCCQGQRPTHPGCQLRERADQRRNNAAAAGAGERQHQQVTAVPRDERDEVTAPVPADSRSPSQ
jgi:hypothetical protein